MVKQVNKYDFKFKNIIKSESDSASLLSAPVFYRFFLNPTSFDNNSNSLFKGFFYNSFATQDDQTILLSSGNIMRIGMRRAVRNLIESQTKKLFSYPIRYGNYYDVNALENSIDNMFLNTVSDNCALTILRDEMKNDHLKESPAYYSEFYKNYRKDFRKTLNQFDSNFNVVVMEQRVESYKIDMRQTDTYYTYVKCIFNRLFEKQIITRKEYDHYLRNGYDNINIETWNKIKNYVIDKITFKITYGDIKVSSYSFKTADEYKKFIVDYIRKNKDKKLGFIGTYRDSLTNKEDDVIDSNVEAYHHGYSYKIRILFKTVQDKKIVYEKLKNNNKCHVINDLSRRNWRIRYKTLLIYTDNRKLINILKLIGVTDFEHQTVGSHKSKLKAN